MSDLTIHQPSHSRHSLGVTLDVAMMTVCLPQSLVAPHTQDGVLHHYAALGKRCVVRYVLQWSLFVVSSRSVLIRSSRLSARREAQFLRVEGGYAYIR